MMRLVDRTANFTVEDSNDEEDPDLATDDKGLPLNDKYYKRLENEEKFVRWRKKILE